MWTAENRSHDDRGKLRCPTDLTDANWSLMAPLIPPAKRGGNQRMVDERAVWRRLRYILSTGCQWRAIPRDLPPRSTHHKYFQRWGASITRSMCDAANRLGGKPARRPRSSSARTREKAASIDPHGYDAAKKIKGKKRHLLADTLGLILRAVVQSASIQHRDGSVLVMATLFGMFPFLRKLFADGGDQGPAFQAALKRVPRGVDVEIVKRSDEAKGFVVLPKRWIAERTIAWLNRCRRLAKDNKNLSRKALALRRMESIRVLVRKPCNTMGGPETEAKEKTSSLSCSASSRVSWVGTSDNPGTVQPSAG